ncbi:MAG: hypothetical protein WCB79_07115 [Halobacteriota archaeon]
MAQETNEEANAAFLLSLIGGVFILIGSLVVLGLGMFGTFGIGYTGLMMSRMMGGFGTVGVLGGVSIIAVSVIGIASAVIVIYGAFSIRDKPTARNDVGAPNFGVLFDKPTELGGILSRGNSWHTRWNTCYGRKQMRTASFPNPSL